MHGKGMRGFQISVSETAPLEYIDAARVFIFANSTRATWRQGLKPQTHPPAPNSLQSSGWRLKGGGTSEQYWPLPLRNVNGGTMAVPSTVV